VKQKPSIRPRLSDVADQKWPGLLVAGLFYAAAMGVVVPALRTPAEVDHLTIDNPHDWRVNVDVTDAERDGWLGIGGLDRESEQRFGSVIDQGDEWIFQFAYSGKQTELRVTREQLERDDWRVTVPDEFADRLRSANVPETP
jgi:hypothetical protein